MNEYDWIRGNQKHPLGSSIIQIVTDKEYGFARVKPDGRITIRTLRRDQYGQLEEKITKGYYREDDWISINEVEGNADVLEELFKAVKYYKNLCKDYNEKQKK